MGPPAQAPLVGLRPTASWFLSPTVQFYARHTGSSEHSWVPSIALTVGPLKLPKISHCSTFAAQR